MIPILSASTGKESTDRLGLQGMMKGDSDPLHPQSGFLTHPENHVNLGNSPSVALDKVLFLRGGFGSL